MKEKIKIATRENIMRMIGIAVLANMSCAVAIRLGYAPVDWIVYLSLITLLPLFGAGLALRDIPALNEGD